MVSSCCPRYSAGCTKSENIKSGEKMNHFHTSCSRTHNMLQVHLKAIHVFTKSLKCIHASLKPSKRIVDPPRCIMNISKNIRRKTSGGKTSGEKGAPHAVRSTARCPLCQTLGNFRDRFDSRMHDRYPLRGSNSVHASRRSSHWFQVQPFGPCRRFLLLGATACPDVRWT